MLLYFFKVQIISNNSNRYNLFKRSELKYFITVRNIMLKKKKKLEISSSSSAERRPLGVLSLGVLYLHSLSCVHLVFSLKGYLS